MGLMDKVKAQATQLAQKTQEAAQEGKSRIDQAQAGRRGDVLLRQLGALVFAERTGRGTADSQAKIDELVSTISTHEKENGLNLTQNPVPPPGSPAGQTGSAPGQSSSYAPGGDPSSSYQDAPGGFPTSGQTFFPPPDESGQGNPQG